MKNIILILVLLVSVLGIAAQETTSTPVPAATVGQPNAQDIQNAREILQKIINDGKAPATDSKQKTVADVLDKGLDVVTGYVSTLEGIVSKYAPEVWRIMIRQQYAKAIAYPAFWGLMLLGVFIIRQILSFYFGNEKGEALFHRGVFDTDYGAAKVWFVGILPTLLALPFTVLFLYNLTEAIMVFINPEYYALKDIISLLR